jgi:hypothetical protein
VRLALAVLLACSPGPDRRAADAALQDCPAPGFVDADGDGYGEAAAEPCADPPGVAVGGDCDDLDAGRYPGAQEVCDGADDDCDGEVDEGVSLHLFKDGDGDGWGAGPPIVSCTPLAGTVWRDGDCDDDDPRQHPEALERCTGEDDDCDGRVDDADDDLNAAPRYADVDGDGLGDPSVVVVACAPAGAVDNADDCDDTDPEVGHLRAFREDADGDGFGGDVRRFACTAPPGFVLGGGPADCDDADPLAWPGAPERCDDFVDQDCDGVDQFCLPDTADWIGGGEGAYDLAGGVIGVGRTSDGAPWLIVSTDLPIDTLNWLPTGHLLSAEGDERIRDVRTAFVQAPALAGPSPGLGSELHALDDLDGDGEVDLLAAAEWASDIRGAVYLFAGPPDPAADPAPIATVRGSFEDSFRPQFGQGLSVGDVTGDGQADLVVPDASHNDLRNLLPTRLVVLPGPLTGELWAADGLQVGVDAERTSVRWGTTHVADVDGDGVQDVLVSAPVGPEVFDGLNIVWHILPGPLTPDLVLPDAGSTWSGESRGSGCSDVGDANGDGLPDLLLGVTDGDRSEFRIDGPLIGGGDVDASIAWSAAGESLDHSMDLGCRLAHLSGDSTPETVIGGRSSAADDRGTVRVYSNVYGAATVDMADTALLGEPSGWLFGVHLMAVPDLDGDGTEELLTQDYGVDGFAGAAYLFLGATMMP